MIIVLESFSGYLIGLLGGDTLVTPTSTGILKRVCFFLSFMHQAPELTRQCLQF